MPGFFDPSPPVTHRPLSLTIIGWYLFVAGLASLTAVLIPRAFPEIGAMWSAMGMDQTLLLSLSTSTGVLSAVAGTAILKRLAWGRTLYLVYAPLVAIAGGFLFTPYMVSSLLGGLATFGVLAWFLTRPAANGYFDGEVVEAPPEARLIRTFRRTQGTRNDLLRVFGVIVGCGSALILMTAPSIMATSGGLGLDEPAVRAAVVATGWVLFFFALVSLTTGVLLWGYRRAAAYLGWTFLVTGALLFVSALSILATPQEAFLQSMPPEANVSPEVLGTMLKSMGRGMSLAGIIYALIGAPLLMYSLKKDRENAGQTTENGNR